MKSQDLETKSAGFYAAAAARDARMRSIAMQSTYSQSQQVSAERMKMVMPMVYKSKAVHINYRKKFIAVKLENPVVSDRKSLKLLEADYAKIGVTKHTSEQGIVYRIPRA